MRHFSWTFAITQSVSVWFGLFTHHDFFILRTEKFCDRYWIWIVEYSEIITYYLQTDRKDFYTNI